MKQTVIILLRVFPIIFRIIAIELPSQYLQIWCHGPVLHTNRHKVNVGEMEINPEKLDIVLHSAALFALLKAKANSLLQLPGFPNADAVIYSRCTEDAFTLSQMAKCVVLLIRARDQMEGIGTKGEAESVERDERTMEITKSETDWMGWPHRLGKWLLDKIARGDALTWKSKSDQIDGWRDQAKFREKTKSEDDKKMKMQKKEKTERQKATENAKHSKETKNSGEELKKIILMGGEAVERLMGRRRARNAGTDARLMKNIAKLKRIQHFFEMVDHCNQYMGRMGQSNSDFLSQFSAVGDQSAHDVHSSSSSAVHFLIQPTQLDLLAAELQRVLHNYTFHSLPILSPRILSLLPDTKTENDGLNLLSPTVFSFHDEGIFSLPSLFGLISTSETDLVELLDLIMELAGASRVLEKIEAQIESRQTIVERELYPRILKLENVERKWQMIRKMFSEAQKRQLKEFGYTLLGDKQFRNLYGRRRNDFRTLDEVKLEEDILRIAKIEDRDNGRRKVSKRDTDEKQQPNLLLFRVSSKSASRHSADLPEMLPFMFTNKLHQGPIVVNGAVLAPRAFFSALSSPNFMTINLLSPIAFASSVMSPRAMATSILSPTAFTANVLNPNALWSEVLSPKFFHTNVVSPRALAALVLSPRTMLGEVLSPKLIEARVLNPGTFFIGVLGPNILQPRVLSPNNFGITVLNPNILSPTILSKGNFTVQVLSPSIMSDDLTPDQFLRGQWQNASNPSRPSSGG